MKEWKKKFKKTKAIIGMIHVDALPGTPQHTHSMSQIIVHATKEAKIYQDAGLDAIMLENMHDVPYVNREVGPEITAAMTAVAIAVKQVVQCPVGLQILAGANKQALAVALAAELDFIRAEGFIFAHIADEGFMDGQAAALLRYRKAIGAEGIKIFTDIKKKHSSHAITADVKIEATTEAAEFFLSDGIIITGPSTGNPVSIYDLQAARNATQLPLLAGSGITDVNIQNYWKYADGFIIGSYFKAEGCWKNPVSPRRVKAFMDVIREFRG